MHNLIVDIGNTFTKIAVFEGDKIVFQQRVESIDDSIVCGIIAQYPNVTRAIVSSTRGDVVGVMTILNKRVGYCLELTSEVCVPIDNGYLTPQTLGHDRLAASVGAMVAYPKSNVMIVDFGTAITVDLVTAEGRFNGGIISPGVSTRFRSLHNYTTSLPMCEPTEEFKLYGQTTTEAIEQGVMNGISFEIEGYIWRMEEKYGKLCIIFTGGDAKNFVKRIKNTIFADCNLVLCGLNRILEYNANEEYHQ